MPEVIIKYKSHKTLQALLDIAKYFDFTVTTPPKVVAGKTSGLPIEFAQEPNIMALAGIWKDKEITLEELRKKAWGDRV